MHTLPATGVTRERPKRAARERLRLTICGAVQGMGFRPFVHRLAGNMELPGWIQNSPQGVTIEVEGKRERLNEFLLRLTAEKPAHSLLQGMEPVWLPPAGYDGFEIRASAGGGAKTSLMLPDIATCPECLAELFDPANRRHRYPFTNCTHCGPRFSIMESLPYDRANTSMRGFTMCARCQAEYEDPHSRRFHAQPNACPECGPQLELWDAAGQVVAGRDKALVAAAEGVRKGWIVAIKGLGGFHLVVDATSDVAIQRLRTLKPRQEKPFAVMLRNLGEAHAHCAINDLEGRLLTSPEAPIVLVRRAGRSTIVPSVAPGNPYLGVMLPYTPLHHLLLAELDLPVVATSGNISDEPICTDEREAVARLRGIADLFLVHNRRIVRHVDDSVVRIMLGRELMLRRARGYAPLPVAGAGSAMTFGLPETFPGRAGLSDADKELSPALMAVGAHLKNTIALTVGGQAVVSQHIGDLETEQALDAFRRAGSDLQRVHGCRAVAIAADAHPDYLSTKFARAQATPVMSVQHHHAHILSCLAENEIAGPALGVAWDGTGYGPDGTIWGGEFLRVRGGSFERFAALRAFRLPGADAAVREPRRAAFGVLHELAAERAFDESLATVQAFNRTEAAALKTIMARQLNAPLTSSAGRLFDAIASIIGLRQRSAYEGQAAMELEFAAADSSAQGTYAFDLAPTAPAPNPQAPTWSVDWRPMVLEILSDIDRRIALPDIAAKFHNTLALIIVAVAQRAGEPRVALSGGCFQNRELTERAVRGLEAAGFQPIWHQRVPPNDGGIALGQLAAAQHAFACASPSQEKS